MAKKHSSSHFQSSRGRRAHSSFHPSANRTLLPALGLSPIPFLPDVTSEPLVEDRRLFHFEPEPQPLDVDGVPARYTVRNRPRPKTAKPYVNRFGPKVHSQTKAIRAFEEPDRVMVCLRRQARKEVLFAKRKAGRGGNRPPRRTWLSSISCRR